MLAATEQQDSIGYNGTSGSIEAINNNLYLVSIYVQEYLTSSTDGRKIKHFQYHSDATATQAEIAIGSSQEVEFNNWSKEARTIHHYLVHCVMMLGATEANGMLTGTLTATSGIQDSISWWSYLTAAVGDFLRL